MDLDDFTNSISVEQIINIRPQTEKIKRKKLKYNKIIRSEQFSTETMGSCLVGGDTDADIQHAPPSILLEKNEKGEITRIIVKCSCGQHAELVCQYEE